MLLNHFMGIIPDTTNNRVFKTKIIARKTLPLPSNMHSTMGLVSNDGTRSFAKDILTSIRGLVWTVVEENKSKNIQLFGLLKKDCFSFHINKTLYVAYVKILLFLSTYSIVK